jgi:hypothetical protein
MTEAALRDYLATAGKSSPLVTSKIDELISRGAYLRPRFFAFGYDGATVIGNVSIDSRETEGYTLEMLLPAIEGMLGQVGATGIGSSRVRLPAGDAVRVTYSITTRVKQMGATYFLEDGGLLYGVAFTCLAAPANTCLEQAAAMVRTLAITP